MNVKLCYLYRDAANYKRYGEVVFSNDSELPIQKIKAVILASLIEGEFFHAGKWGLPDLHFEKWDEETDHCYHEYNEIEETNVEPSNDDIATFLNLITGHHSQSL